jgi:hypothetical protein
LGIPLDGVQDALVRLDEEGVIALYPETGALWLAHPFSAADEPFKVRTDEGTWDAVCVWDGLGVLAVLGSDGDVATKCPDCDESLELSVRSNAIAPSDYVVHFGVPARRWYEDIAHT